MAQLHPILVNGQWVAPHSTKARTITNPATLDTLGTVADCDLHDVDHAVMAALNAQRAWWKVPGVEKARLLREVAAWIRDKGPELAPCLRGRRESR